jgi:hypothetical protein
MTWYLGLYLLLYLAVSVGGMIDDRYRRWPWQLAMGLTLVVGTSCVLAFAYPQIARPLGRWLWAMIAFALVMEAWSLKSDLRDVAREGASPRERAVLATAVAILTLPAYALGIAVAARAE